MSTAARQLRSLLLTTLAIGSVAAAAAQTETTAGGEQKPRVWILRFDLGGSQLSESHRAMLDEVTRALAEDPAVRVRIVGHSDSLGPEPVNLQVSRQRAEAVAAYLLRVRGIAANRMVTEAKGSLKPVATNQTEEGRQRNRRVVVALLDDAAAERRRAKGVWVVHFDFGGSSLSTAATALLDEVARELRRDLDLRALVVGHSDNTGQEPINLELSRQRAEAAKNYLTRQRAIDGRRIRTRAKGSLKPVASNETPEGQRRNRRAVIVLETPSPTAAGTAAVEEPATSEQTDAVEPPAVEEPAASEQTDAVEPPAVAGRMWVNIVVPIPARQ